MHNQTCYDYFYFTNPITLKGRKREIIYTVSPSTVCWPVPGVQLANQSVMAKDFIEAEE